MVTTDALVIITNSVTEVKGLSIHKQTLWDQTPERADASHGDTSGP